MCVYVCVKNNSIGELGVCALLLPLWKVMVCEKLFYFDQKCKHTHTHIYIYIIYIYISYIVSLATMFEILLLAVVVVAVRGEIYITSAALPLTLMRCQA